MKLTDAIAGTLVLPEGGTMPTTGMLAWDSDEPMVVVLFLHFGGCRHSWPLTRYALKPGPHGTVTGEAGFVRVETDCTELVITLPVGPGKSVAFVVRAADVQDFLDGTAKHVNRGLEEAWSGAWTDGLVSWLAARIPGIAELAGGAS